MFKSLRENSDVTRTHFRPHTSQGFAPEESFPQDELLLIGEQDCQDPRKICEGLIRSKERKDEGGVWVIKRRSDKGSERTWRQRAEKDEMPTVPRDGGSKEIEMRSRHFVTPLSIPFLYLPPSPSRFSSLECDFP